MRGSQGRLLQEGEGAEEKGHEIDVHGRPPKTEGQPKDKLTGIPTEARDGEGVPGRLEREACVFEDK